MFKQVVGHEENVHAQFGCQAVFSGVIAHHEYVFACNAGSFERLGVVARVGFDAGACCVIGHELEVGWIKACPA